MIMNKAITVRFNGLSTRRDRGGKSDENKSF